MTTVQLTPSEFADLPEYSASLPTATTVGKRWKAKYRGENNWWMGEYVRELPVPTCCRYHRCIVGLVDERPCTRVRTAEGKVYDPENPDAWHEPPARQVQVEWSKIEVLPIVRHSKAEDDLRCFDDATGWFIHAPRARNAEVARFLELDSVYCVGAYPGKAELPEVVFVQPSGHLDERNNKVEYFVVTDLRTVQGVLAILKRRLSSDELRKARAEDDQDMELVRRGFSS